jgi:uncharacterized protein YndB with AHSA1/START domain
MQTRQIEDEILIQTNAASAFEALIKPSMIKKWWLASSAIVIPEKDGLYALSWGDDPDEPDYVTYATIKEYIPPKKLTLLYQSYRSSNKRLPFEADFEVQFNIAATESHCTLTVKQTGFPIDKLADDYYNGCIQGWNDTLKWIKLTLEYEAK